MPNFHDCALGFWPERESRRWHLEYASMKAFLFVSAVLAGVAGISAHADAPPAPPGS